MTLRESILEPLQSAFEEIFKATGHVPHITIKLPHELFMRLIEECGLPGAATGTIREAALGVIFITDESAP